jgi:alpha-galactosidase
MRAGWMTERVDGGSSGKASRLMLLLLVAAACCTWGGFFSHKSPAAGETVAPAALEIPDAMISDEAADLAMDARFTLRWYFKSPRGRILAAESAPLCRGTVTSLALKEVDGPFGKGAQLIAEGSGTKITVTVFKAFPGSAVIREEQAQSTSSIRREVRISVPAKGSGRFWSFQGGAEKWGEDYVLPIGPGFERTNAQGALGGVPLVDVWSPAFGVSISHIERAQRNVSLPVSIDAGGAATLGLLCPQGDPLPAVLITVHTGDCFLPLRRYAILTGLSPRAFPPAAFEPSWETYGYEESWTVRDILDRTAELRSLGISVITIDSGWYKDFITGDYDPDPDKIHEGDIASLVETLHRRGFKVKIWWCPGQVSPESRIARLHPDWLIRDRRGRAVETPDLAGGGGDYFLCPALAQVRDQHRAWTELFLRAWGLDGFKMDAVYGCPPCHDKAHGHSSPWESTESFPRIFREIAETASIIHSAPLLEVCNCGVAQNVFLFPWVNQVITSDPVGARQARLRLKALKALFGPAAPVLGDYVELTSLINGEEEEREGPPDFASLVGTGAVLQTKFARSPGKEYLQWFRLARSLELARAEYLNLYDMGWDYPEGHAMRRGDSLFYGFFIERDGMFDGNLELRGLAPGVNYRIIDYENATTLGTVPGGPEAAVKARFKSHILLEAAPVD